MLFTFELNYSDKSNKVELKGREEKGREGGTVHVVWMPKQSSQDKFSNCEIDGHFETLILADLQKLVLTDRPKNADRDSQH